MNKNNIEHNTQTKAWLNDQTTTNRTLITAHNDEAVYFGIILDIDVYEPKQSKAATTSINESNTKIFTAIGAVVIDIHRRTQTENSWFDNFLHDDFRCSVTQKTTFFTLCSLMCINNYSIYNSENFSV